MKKILALLLALCLTALPALAESPAPLEAEATLSVDLDGDGSQEQVSWVMVPIDAYDARLTLTVAPEGGEALTYATDICSAGQVYVTDLDGDGRQEILMSGDVMSDDYFTWCLRYDGAALYEVLFPDAGRGDSTEGFYRYGYGGIVSLDGGLLTLSGSQDVLGTWFATRTLGLTPHERFEFRDDGLWTRDLADLNDDDLWEYAALTAIADLPYRADDGSAAILAPGTKLIVYATDKRETAHFCTRDGLTGTLAISPDYERGWGWLVDGVPEDQCFEYIPYAD